MKHVLTPTLRSTFASALALLLAFALAFTVVPSARAASGSDASLGSLTVSSGALSPAFDPAVTSYGVTVSHTTTAFSFTPVAGDPGAIITTWNGDVSAAAPSGTATNAFLRPGLNILTATVVSVDGLASTQYVLMVTREAPPAPAYDLRLSSLGVSTGTLSPEFDSNVSGYSVALPFVTNSITFSATALESGNTVTMTNAATSAVGATMFVPLAGLIALIKVTAPDSTERTYTVHVTRAPAPTANVDLASIGLSAGTLTPAFDPAVQYYTVAVPYAVRSMGITATAAESANTIKLNNVTMTPGTPSTVPVIFDDAGNGFAIQVTAPNGVEKLYTVVVTRDQPSHDADLTSLSLSEGTLSPTFSNAETDYTATVPYLTTSVQVTGEVSDTTAILRVNGHDTESGAPSAPIALPVGSTQIVVAATAEDGVTETSRTITVTREAPVLDLAALSIAGHDLAPVFDAGTDAYTLEVPYLTSSVDVTAAAVESDWTVAIDGVDGGASTVALAVGDTTVTVKVTALYGESKEYTVVVTRLPVPVAVISFVLGFGAGDVAGGAEAQVNVTNLLPGSAATVTMHSTPVVLGSTIVLGNGSVSLDVRLPASVPAGAHRLVLEGTAQDGSAVSATAWFTVLRDGTIGAVSLTGPVAYDEAAPAALAATGADPVGPLASFAVLLMAAGLLLLRARRTRRAGTLAG